jgi:SAM-dependent methyltransferase
MTSAHDPPIPGSRVCDRGTVAGITHCRGYDRLVATAHYDGVADWYDENFPPSPQVTDTVRRLAGRGPGRALDLGCGTGFHLPTLVELGWTVAGVDVSEDQLRVARKRVGETVDLVHGDGTELPFDDGSFDLVLSAFTHTDVDGFATMIGEAARTLAPRGRIVYLGPHPCFVGPHSTFVEGRGVPTLHPGYADTGRYEPTSGRFSPTGIRARVGAVHLPLGELLQAFLGAGLHIDAFEEPVPVDREYPHWLALRAMR